MLKLLILILINLLPISLAQAETGAQNTESPYQQGLRTVITETNNRIDLELGKSFGRGDGREDVRTSMVKKELAKVYDNVLTHLINKAKLDSSNLKDAQNYFDGVKEQLPAEMQDNAQLKLKAINDQIFAFTYTDSLFTKITTTPQQLKKVQSDYEGHVISTEQRILIEQRIEQHSNQLRK